MKLGLVGMIDYLVCEVEWRCDEAMNWGYCVFEFRKAMMVLRPRIGSFSVW